MAILDLVEQGINLIDGNMYPEAEMILREATDIDRRNESAWYHLGIALSCQTKYEDAEIAFERATDICRGHTSAWNELGWSLLQQGRYLAADRAFQVSIDQDREFLPPLLNLGISSTLRGKYSKASRIFSKATQIAPNNIYAWLHLGDAKTHLKDSFGAADAYQRMTEIAPESYFQIEELEDDEALFWSAIWDDLGQALCDIGELEESRQSFTRSIELDPSNWRHWFHLGIACGELGETAEEESAYRTAISLDASSVAWVNLGAVLSNAGEFKEAEGVYLDAAAIDPKDPYPIINLSLIYFRQQKYEEASQIADECLRLRPSSWVAQICWYIVANSGWWLGSPPKLIVHAYKKMSNAIEYARQQEDKWEARLSGFEKPANALVEAAIFSLGATGEYAKEAFEFAVQAKARTLGELLEYVPSRLSQVLPPRKRKRLKDLEAAANELYLERRDWGSTPIVPYHVASTPTKSRDEPSLRDRRHINSREQTLEREYGAFVSQVVIDHPELEPFILGPRPQRFKFSLSKLQKKLKSGEAVLEFVFSDKEPIVLLAFLVSKDGLVGSYHCMGHEPLNGTSGTTLKEWHDEVMSTLRVEISHSERSAPRDITLDNLNKWSEMIYGPFVEQLKSIHRLWICPHSFLAHLPFNAIGFPDKISRDLAVVPSATSLTQKVPRTKKLKPKFTLGVIAADGRKDAPLSIQDEEVYRLKKHVPKSRRRWELAGNQSERSPTLQHLGNQPGLTKCLVVSCHGGGPDQDWGRLVLGTQDNPEIVTGRQLVESLLLRAHSRVMEVDLVATSACLTGIIESERGEEWLGLPAALQSIWKTRTLVLTLWEVEELPAMIWAVEFFRFLTQGLSAGEALIRTQERLRTITSEEVEITWLSSAKQRLSAEQWQRVYDGWIVYSNSTLRHPFSDPVHWAAFTLIGDPRITISRKRR